MSDEETPAPVVVDGVTPNGIDSFTSGTYQIAISVKEKLTAGDLEKWTEGFKLVADEPIAGQRVRIFFAAVKAAILTHITDDVTVATMRSLDPVRAQWYGSQLIQVYRRITNIDPN